MCKSQVENFFYLCGHINNIELPSLNPDCPKTEVLKRWDVVTKFPRCLGVRGGWGHFMIETTPCGGFEGEIDQLYPLDNQPLWQKYTEREIWEQRELFLKHTVDVFAQQRRKLEKKEFVDESLKGVSPIEMTYYVDSTEAYNPIVKRVPKPEVHDDTCAICKGLLGGDGDEACGSKEVGKLPCEHVFGYDCIRELIYNHKYDHCPLCNHKFRIYRFMDEFCHTGDFETKEAPITEALRDSGFSG
jgi:hypothetical protein